MKNLYRKGHIPKQTFRNRRMKSQHRPAPSDPRERRAIGKQNLFKIDYNSLNNLTKNEREERFAHKTFATIEFQSPWEIVFFDHCKTMKSWFLIWTCR